MSSTAIFKSASQALHVSYLIHSLPATSRSPTAVVIDRLRQELAPWEGVAVNTESRVNFGNLTPLEVRAQCSQVISMVNHLPHEAERSACRAIYGAQVEKAAGVQGMAAYLEPALKRGKEYSLYVAWHVFMTAKQRQGVTQGDIASHFGHSLRTVEADCREVRRYGVSLHGRAVEALAVRFQAGGLVAESEVRLT